MAVIRQEPIEVRYSIFSCFAIAALAAAAALSRRSAINRRKGEETPVAVQKCCHDHLGFTKDPLLEVITLEQSSLL